MDDSLFQKLTLPDLWQQQAVSALREGRDVIVDAPTGAGKTRVFELIAGTPAWRKSHRQAIYTVPTRALANDKWAEWDEAGWDVGIATGDIAINTSAPVVVATLETQRERFLRGDGPALLVVDEYQMISDPTRGLHYELVLTLAPRETQLLLLSGSVGNPERIAKWLAASEREVEVVQVKERPVPLDEVHVLGLPHQAPKAIKGFWPRLAAEVLLADMAPLLIFVPHRKGTEKVARQIAEVLPARDPLVLTPLQEQLAGKELSRLLAKRVCYHHSGLHYELRASLLEPLARSGQLRVIVATMGLAAGINFSVRSVFVAESTYHDGPFLHHLQPDELLQMFGRAGRRGKDTVGYVVHGDKNPRLTDARHRDLRRANEIDWPTLIRIMHQAATHGIAPFQAAADFSGRLFSDQPIALGSEGKAPTDSSDTPTGNQNRFGLRPTRREILNAQGQWEPFDKARWGTITLTEAKVYRQDAWREAKRDFDLIAKRTRLGRAKKLEDDTGPFLAKEIVLATRPDTESPWRVSKALRKRLPRSLGKPFEDAHAHLPAILQELTPQLEGGRPLTPSQTDTLLAVDVDFRAIDVRAYRDQSNTYLIDPPERMADLEQDTGIVAAHAATTVEPPPDSPVHAWRALGLIDADGTPTRRGILFSYFYHGEGLAIAAGLEQESYPIDELLWHLANLRSGHRFRSLEDGEGERLSTVCRQTYGPVHHAGYLRLGLPLQYGEGAAEALRSHFEGRRPTSHDEDGFGRGDIERVVHEWLSLLRQIVHAPEYPWERWQSFQAQAALLLDQYKPKQQHLALSSLNAQQRQPFTRHRLHFSDLRR